MSKLAWIVGGVVATLIGGVVVLAATSNSSQQGNTNGSSTTAKLPPTTSTTTGTSTNTTSANIINAPSIVSTFPGAMINSNGLITTSSGTSINQITSVSGFITSTNSTPTNTPNVVVGTEDLSNVGGPSSAAVYSYGSAFQGPGEYVSKTGAPEYLSNASQYAQQAALGFVG